METKHILYYIKSQWISLGATMGRVINPVIMTVLYILIIVPLVLLSRPFLSRKTKGYINRNHVYTPSDFENLW